MTRESIRTLLNEIYPMFRDYIASMTDADRRMTVDLWADAFADTEETDLREALRQYRREKRYFPDVSELRPFLPKKEPEKKRSPVTPAEYLRILDFIYDLKQGASGRPNFVGYLDALDRWEKSMDRHGARQDDPCRIAAEKKRREILSSVKREETVA